MKSLFQKWHQAASRIEKSKRRLLLFDFDGTLVPIRSHPKDVYLPAGTRRLLTELAAQPQCTVGIVSGRPLRDLVDRVGIQGLVYIGNHGFEMLRGRDHFVHPSANAKSGLLRRLSDVIASRLQGIKGAWVENKRFTMTIHYRQTLPAQIPRVQEIVQDVVRERTVPGGLFLKNGKKVVEIRPERNWNKGSAVDLLRRIEPGKACTLYVGDDVTDEDVFRILSPGDVSVRVGADGPSKAEFMVRHPSDVLQLLRKLHRLKK